MKYTDEALKVSPVLRELDRLCTKEIPVPNGFRLVSRTGQYAKQNQSPYLSYDYYSDADYKSVKGYYEDYFSKSGWRATENKEGGWGPPWHAVFRKDSYKVAIQYGALDEDVKYNLFCEKVLTEGE